MRVEVGPDLLHFASGGELVAVVRGANAPLLEKTIREQLEAEKRVLAEGRERRVNDGDDEDLVSSEKACTLAIIKPDAVVHGKTDEIIMKDTFEKLVHHMCSGPSHLLILTRTEGTDDVVTAWRTLMGPCDPHVARREQPDSPSEVAFLLPLPLFLKAAVRPVLTVLSVAEGLWSQSHLKP
ncbi:hypothetical protein MG293_000253 [Ovis ammon polii]|uniref:Nucleoside diphosphate kinase-like domain-containing protein n=1 Tax=Ovis ammon polii TaxID=230172 RepID=A0AAD4UIN8_OVIAM|nr:hypothetical protein MG293_000253 [Ovis ammon polii]